MTIKAKLLEAVGEVDINDIGTEALVDILVSRIKAQDKKIQELHGENAQERQRLHNEVDSLHMEQRKMRSDPLYWATGLYCFKGLAADLVKLEVQGAHVKIYLHRKRNAYPLQQISPNEFDILEQGQSR